MKLNPARKKSLKELEGIIKYEFKDLGLLNRALTHSSYANENKVANNENNERLEFLGDVVISLIVSEYIFKRYSDLPEGELTKKRSSVVCESSFAYASRNLNLGKFFLLGKGEDSTGGRERDSLLADGFEALCGAMYIDGGIEVTRKFLLDTFEQEVLYAISKGNLFIDFKTILQEYYQKQNNLKIKYKVEKEVGPDHRKKFYMGAYVNNDLVGNGMGSNKKEAEQMAAKQALYNLGKLSE